MFKVIRVAFLVIIIIGSISCESMDPDAINNALNMLGWFSEYMTGGTSSTGTSFKLYVFDGKTGRPVSEALIQISALDSSTMLQGKTNAQGEIYFKNLRAGRYTVRIWKGREFIEDVLFLEGPVSARANL